MNKETNNLNIIGSDEAGKGDYFGPLVVTAVYFTPEKRTTLKKIKIVDSKQLTTKEIYEIGPILIKNLIHVSITIDNKKYNYYHTTHFNLNKICALMHNEVILKIKEKINNYDLIIIDQFVKKEMYFNYLKGASKKEENITLFPKADNSYLAVASASIISRYYYLKTLEQFEKKYKIPFPSGSGTKTNIIGRKFYYKYGEKELKKVSKFHFKNTFHILP